jgi:hypothetical protein
MYKIDKQIVLNEIDQLTKTIKNGEFDECIKEEHRKDYKLGQLGALLMIWETIKYDF